MPTAARSKSRITSKRRIPSKRPSPGDTIAYREYLRELERTGNNAALQRELKRVKLSRKELAAIAAKCPPIQKWQD